MQLCTLLNKLFVVSITMVWILKIFFCDTWSRGWKTRSQKRETNNPPYVENNYRIKVKITFMLIAYLVLLCEFFWEFSIFHFCRPLVDIYCYPLLRIVWVVLAKIRIFKTDLRFCIKLRKRNRLLVTFVAFFLTLSGLFDT